MSEKIMFEQSQTLMYDTTNFSLDWFEFRVVGLLCRPVRSILHRQYNYDHSIFENGRECLIISKAPYITLIDNKSGQNRFPNAVAQTRHLPTFLHPVSGRSDCSLTIISFWVDSHSHSEGIQRNWLSYLAHNQAEWSHHKVTLPIKTR